MKTLEQKLLSHIEEQDNIIEAQLQELLRLGDIITGLTIAAQTGRVNVVVTDAAIEKADMVVLGFSKDLAYTVDFTNLNKLTIDASPIALVNGDGDITPIEQIPDIGNEYHEQTH